MISPKERFRRDNAIALLRAFAAGKLTNDEFEERYDALLDERPVREWEDRALWALKTVAWYCYDDMSTHRLEGERALTKEGKKSFARWILFLQTDRPYEWKRHSFIAFDEVILNWLTLGWWSRRQFARSEKIDWDIWPFRRVEDFEDAKLDRRR